APERHGQLGSSIGHRFLGRFPPFALPAFPAIGHRPASLDPSLAKARAVAKSRRWLRGEPKNPSLRPSANTSQWCSLPASRPFKRDVPGSPSLQRAAQVPSAGANAFQKQGSLGAIRTQLQRPPFGGVLALEGDMPWSSAVVDSCV